MATVVVVGNVDPESIENKSRKCFHLFLVKKSKAIVLIH